MPVFICKTHLTFTSKTPFHFYKWNIMGWAAYTNLMTSLALLFWLPFPETGNSHKMKVLHKWNLFQFRGRRLSTELASVSLRGKHHWCLNNFLNFSYQYVPDRCLWQCRGSWASTCNPMGYIHLSSTPVDVQNRKYISVVWGTLVSGSPEIQIQCWIQLLLPSLTLNSSLNSPFQPSHL